MNPISTGQRGSWTGALLGLLDAGFGVALIVLAAAWLLDPLRLALGPFVLLVPWGLKPLLAAAAFLAARILVQVPALRAGIQARGLWQFPLYQKLIMGMAVTFALGGGLETILWAAGFKANLPPIVIMGRTQAGELRQCEEGVVADPILLWRFQPRAFFAGRRINALGFREREVDPAKKPGAIRVICLGDSITAQGHPGYARLLHDRLASQPPTPERWEAFGMGVHGYTALQGLRLFQSLGKRLQPDIVTIWFGWNDHWLNEQSDRQQMAVELRPAAARVAEVLRRKRVFMLLAGALQPRMNMLCKKGDKVLRVAPDEYRAALGQLVREVRAAGAVPILVTAPRRNLSDSLVSKGFAPSPEEARQIHDRYVAITREVARDTRANLLDLAALFAEPECDAYFAADGIHFDQYIEEGYNPAISSPQPGLERVAAELDAKIREIIRSDAWLAFHASQR